MSFSSGFPALSHGLAFTGSARPGNPRPNFEDIYIIAAQWMAAFAMCLRSFFVGGSFDHARGIGFAKGFFKQRNMQWNASFNSPSNYIGPDAGFIAPVFSDHANALKLDPDVSAPIPVLVFSGRPDAVIRGIVSIIVFAFYRVIKRAKAHICDEVSESLASGSPNEPPVANRYSPSAIVSEGFVVRVIASFKHRPINNIKRMRSFRRF